MEAQCRTTKISPAQAMTPEDRAEYRELLVGQIEQALGPSNVDPDRIREILTLAKEGGLDWQAMYAKASSDHPTRWPTPPPIEDVTPMSSPPILG